MSSWANASLNPHRILFVLLSHISPHIASEGSGRPGDPRTDPPQHRIQPTAMRK